MLATELGDDLENRLLPGRKRGRGRAAGGWGRQVIQPGMRLDGVLHCLLELRGDGAGQGLSDLLGRRTGSDHQLDQVNDPKFPGSDPTSVVSSRRFSSASHFIATPGLTAESQRMMPPCPARVANADCRPTLPLRPLAPTGADIRPSIAGAQLPPPSMEVVEVSLAADANRDSDALSLAREWRR